MHTTLDFETTNKRAGVATEPANRIVVTAYKVNAGQVHDGDGWAHELPALLRDSELVIAHHCKFEAGWLYRMGVRPEQLQWFDPMLAEWFLLGNNPHKLSISLDACAARYGLARKEPFIDALMSGGVCPSRMPRQLLRDRCVLDVQTTWELAQLQRERLAKRGKAAQELVRLRCEAAAELALIEAAAAERLWCLDADKVKEATDGATETEAAALRAMRVMSGPLPAPKPAEFDQGSTEDMSEILYGELPRKERSRNKQKYFEPSPPRFALRLGFPKPSKDARRPPSKRWERGSPLLNADIIDDLLRTAVTEQQQQFLTLYTEAREARSLLDKNLKFYGYCLRERGGHYGIELAQGRTATHRLAAQGVREVFADGTELGPQEQNIPRALKGLTRAASPDACALTADAKQLEFRAAAELCADEQAKADVRNPDFDAHIQTLAVLKYGSDAAYADLLARYRQGDKQVAWERNDNSTCKSHTYKPLFGGEKGTPEQERYYRYFRERYKGIADAQLKWQKLVLVNGFHEHIGMRFSYDVRMKRGLLWDNLKGKPAGPAISNHPIQRFATGELMVRALVNAARRLRPLGGRVTGAVHDSVRAAVPRADWQACAKAVGVAFTADVREWLREALGMAWSLPLGVDINVGLYFDRSDISTLSIEG
jgi:hypothetical protein